MVIVFVRRDSCVFAIGVKQNPLSKIKKKPFQKRRVFRNWVQGPDLNRGPSGYEPDELPDCSTLHWSVDLVPCRKSEEDQGFFCVFFN